MWLLNLWLILFGLSSISWKVIYLLYILFQNVAAWTNLAALYLKNENVKVHVIMNSIYICLKFVPLSVHCFNAYSHHSHLIYIYVLGSLAYGSKTLPVPSAHTCASYWQMSNLFQCKGMNGYRSCFKQPNHHTSYVAWLLSEKKGKSSGSKVCMYMYINNII